MRVNLLGAGTSGVDLRSNPLSLGNKKLRFATNLRFHEGVVRTRPGLLVRTLCVSGTLQGLCRYAPAEGLSSQSFGPSRSGVAFVADGDLFFNDGHSTQRVTSDRPYCGLGPVSLFQAENWLIAQNPTGTTIMWDGISEPIKSRGMNETHWNDPQTPWDEALPDRPVADIPDCDPDLEPWWVKFLVIDAKTLLPVASAKWSIRRLSSIAFSGVTPADGSFVVSPAEREYFYNVTAKGYFPVADVRTTFRRPANSDSRDGCYQADAASREINVIIKLTPLPEGWTPGTPMPPPVKVCGVYVYDITVGGEGGGACEGGMLFSNMGNFTVGNIGTVPITVTGVTLANLDGIGPAVPVTINPGTGVRFAVTTHDTPIFGESCVVHTTCTDETFEFPASMP